MRTNESRPVKQFIRETEAATMLGLVPNTLAKWRWRGEGPPFSKLGRVVVYDVDVLQQWVAEREQRSTSDQRGRAGDLREGEHAEQG